MLDFSIVIPTYNRKERLLNTLKRVFNQPQSSDIYIQILNNHSNYNVNEAIMEQFGTEITKNLEVVDYPVNIGGSLNICMPFFYCKTKWMWELSDDDEVMEDSLYTILNDIESYPETGIFKYSYTGYISYKYTDECYNSLDDVIGKNGKKKQTAFMLCSNAVYNMDVLEPYRGRIIQYSYNNIGAYNPICFMLDDKSGILRTRSKAIIHYKENNPGSGWNSLNLYLMCNTFFDYPFKTSGEVLKEFWEDGPVPFRDFMRLISERNLCEDKIKCQLTYDKVRITYLKISRIRILVYWLIFKLYKFTSFNIYKLL